jgi:hypothetical protein
MTPTSVMTLNHDRAGRAAVVVKLTASCDLAGATEVTSEQPGARRHLRTDQDAAGFSATRSYAFPGGCNQTAAEQVVAVETSGGPCAGYQPWRGQGRLSGGRDIAVIRISVDLLGSTVDGGRRCGV